MKKEVIAHKDPKSPVSEVFRTLRTNIQFMNTNKKLETLLITSTLPGEGKSWVASNLAVTFAQAGRKVILVDADMRKGRQYTIFGVSPRPGLSNYLSGVNIEDNDESSEDLSEYIQETEINNLYLMAAGNVPPNPSELLVSPQMTHLIDELKALCDIVIIDGTPSALVTDAVILSRIVDSTVIVTAHKETKKDNLGDIIKNIQNVGGKIAGVVINKIPISAKKYEQTYYYGSTSAGNINSKNRNMKVNQNITKKTKNISSNTKPRPSRPIDERAKKVINQDKPKAFQNRTAKDELDKFKIETKGDITVEKTNDILKQINAYLDKEKKNLN